MLSVDACIVPCVQYMQAQIPLKCPTASRLTIPLRHYETPHLPHYICGSLTNEHHHVSLHYTLQADEEDLQGGIELDGDDLLFNQAIDDFIQVR
jgi:hypothetical protein